jgi:hypothetical protein
VGLFFGELLSDVSYHPIVCHLASKRDWTRKAISLCLPEREKNPRQRGGLAGASFRAALRGGFTTRSGIHASLSSIGTALRSISTLNLAMSKTSLQEFMN